MNGKDLYLRRVARWLPLGMREEVIGELDAAIEEYLADDPTQADPGQIYARLRQDFGHPAVAATRFVDCRPVVSAGLAHAYWRVLAIVCVAVLLIQSVVVVAGSGGALFSIDQIARALLRIAGHLFMGIGLVTMVFVFIDGGWRTVCRVFGIAR